MSAHAREENKGSWSTYMYFAFLLHAFNGAQSPRYWSLAGVTTLWHKLLSVVRMSAQACYAAGHELPSRLPDFLTLAPSHVSRCRSHSVRDSTAIAAPITKSDDSSTAIMHCTLLDRAVVGPGHKLLPAHQVCHACASMHSSSFDQSPVTNCAPCPACFSSSWR